MTLRIGIVGDFNPEFRSHHATNNSLQEAARALGVSLELAWIPTPELGTHGPDNLLEKYDGIWASSASPYVSFEGMLRGIEFARRRDWPFVGT